MTAPEDRQEPVIADSPLSADDGDRVAPAPNRGGAQTVRIAGRKRPRRDLGGRPGRPALIAVLLLLLSIALIYLFWNWRQQQVTNAALSLQLDTAVQRIEALEGAMSEAGISRSATETALDGKVGTLEHEVRKLWDVANKRNKKWIQDNQAALAQLTQASADQKAALSSETSALRKALEQSANERKKASETQAQLQAGLADLSAFQVELERAGTQISELRKSTGQLQKDAETSREKSAESLQAVQQSLLSVQARADQFGVQVARLKAAVSTLEQNLAAQTANGQNQDLEALRKALVENEQAVRSFDAFRRQTNQSITSLQAAVARLQNQN